MTDPKRLETVYRGHRIISAQMKNGVGAAIYLGKASATPLRFYNNTIETATDDARAWVDAKYQASASSRPSPNVALAQEYVDALNARPPKDYELAMLKAHGTHNVLTATQLANAAGYPSYSTANRLYGQLGREIADILHLQPDTRLDGTQIWTSILAFGSDADAVVTDENAEHFRWEIHANLKQALREMGIVM